MNPPAALSKVLVPGSVLLDIYAATGQRFLGGACFNFAYHMHHLRGGVDFVSRVGRDEAGRFILHELERRGFPVHLIQYDPIKPTKTVQVVKNQSSEPSYLISSDVATEYLSVPPWAQSQLAGYGLVYFGTTIQSALKSRTTVRRLLQAVPGIKFCDLNLRPGKFNNDTLAYALRTCTALKLNHEELEAVSRIYLLQGTLEHRLCQLAERFAIPSICLTMAADGSLLHQHHGFFHAAAGPGPVRDTVGAGDAFSAVYAIGLLQGWPPQTMLELAARFASAICAIEGAVPASAAFYEPWRQQMHAVAKTV